MHGSSFSSVYQMHLFMILMAVVISVLVYVWMKAFERATEEDFRIRHAPPPGTLQIMFEIRTPEQELGVVCEYGRDKWGPVGVVELDAKHHVMDVLRYDDPAIRRRSDA